MTFPCQASQLDGRVNFVNHPFVELASHVVTEGEEFAHAIDQSAHDGGLLWNVERYSGVVLVHVFNVSQDSLNARIIFEILKKKFSGCKQSSCQAGA